MKEKIKQEKTPTTGGGDSIFDGVPDIPPDVNVTVSSGPYSEDLPVAGKTVGEVRKRFSDRFDIDAQSQAIVNGVAAGEDTVLNATECLMFIKHAGEKGGSLIRIEDDTAQAYNGNNGLGEMKVEDLCQRVGPGMSTGSVILPYGIKCVLSRGSITLWVWEQPPRIQKLSWIASDSPRNFGPGTKYRDVRIALPYLIIVAAFYRHDNGMPQLMLKDECFFRSQPLKGLEDELCYPALLNCSNYGNNNTGHPLSWICTQYLKQTSKLNSGKAEDRFQAQFEAVRYCLLETSFNLSSENHEGNSWFGASKKAIPQINTVERWEDETKKNPLFVLDVNWLPTDHSVATLADRMFSQYGAPAVPVTTADDLARIIINQ